MANAAGNEKVTLDEEDEVLAEDEEEEGGGGTTSSSSPCSDDVLMTLFRGDVTSKDPDRSIAHLSCRLRSWEIHCLMIFS